MSEKDRRRRSIEKFLNHHRQATWEADDNDGVWCLPENEVGWLLADLIRDIERLEQKLNDNKLN